jgi:methyl-accepting chemotaxis protein
MDVVTQQNASLVEEAAAAAEAMQDQSVNLAQVVSFFTLDAGASGQGQMPQGRTLQGQKLLT